MTRLLIVLAVLSIAGDAQAQTRTPASPLAPPQGNAEPVPTSALDGNWRGTSDGGSCNAPLDYVLTIENGFVDGSATDTTARGPVPNTHHGPPPAPTPGLWQIHGVAKNSGPFSLLSVASVKGSDRREGKLSAQSDGGALVVSETSGCRRTARLARR
ncbi:MAG TPA: hypothetical protein VII10_10780, partial [Reyranella sp.]